MERSCCFGASYSATAPRSSSASMVAGDDGSPEAHESRLAIAFPATPRSSGLVAATYGQYRWWLLDGAKVDRGRYHPFVDPYMTKTAELLREGKGRLDRL